MGHEHSQVSSAFTTMDAKLQPISKRFIFFSFLQIYAFRKIGNFVIYKIGVSFRVVQATPQMD